MELQNAKGTRDFLPEQQILRQEIINTLKEIFELYGYSPLDTPALERYEIISSKYAGGSEILKETFKLKDQGNRELGLRYDLTVPLARVIGMNPQLKLPFKRYQIDKSWRDGPVEASRYREFIQADVDVVGCCNVNAEAEIIAIINAVFKKLNLDIITKINNIKLLNSILDYAGIKKEKQSDIILSIDKLEKFGINTVKEELFNKGLNENSIKKILDLIQLKLDNNEIIKKLRSKLGNNQGLEEIEDLLKILKVLDLKVEFTPSLARGLSYYTGIIIETYLKKSEVKACVCGGGRFDNMISLFLGKGNYPAVGVSFGIDRIYDALKFKRKEFKKTVSEVYIIPIKTFEKSIEIAEKLRKQGIKLDIDLGNRNISKNLDYANSLNIPYVIFVGEKELKLKKLKLRDMKTGKEELLKIEEIIKKLKQ